MASFPEADKWSQGLRPLYSHWVASVVLRIFQRNAGVLRVRAIKLVDGFDSCALREDGQRGLSLD